MSKPKVIKDYEKLPEEVVEQIKLVYPRGFSQHLIAFVNRDGERKMGLPFETEDYYYLIRMTPVRASNIIEEDDDYDDDGVLKAKAKAKYTDKYDDLDFLDDLNANDDNDLGDTEELTDELSDELADEAGDDFDD
ncbi:hypothetical protein [Lewinella cohaerens]|uniref:hypothetical protein n=1 Tax=Lewinella cohaerens TaxID=70995 RepID=UPI0003712DA3|nr:hypothetical protein [Lewinella cohaerens]